MKQSDRQLYKVFVEQHAADVYRYLYRWGLSKAEVEDLVQETFLQAWKSIHTFRQESSPKVWLLAICKRLAWQRTQKRKREKDVAVQVAQEPKRQNDGQGTIEMRSRLRVIEQQLPKLSEAHQEVLHLHYLQELTEPEVAAFLETPVGTIHSRLRAARRQLRFYCQKTRSEEEV